MADRCSATIREALKENAAKRKSITDPKLLALANEAEGKGLSYAASGACDLSLLHIGLAGRLLNGTRRSAPPTKEEVLQSTRDDLKALLNHSSKKQK